MNERLLKKYNIAFDAIQSLQLAIDCMDKVDSIAILSKEYPEIIYKTFRDSLIYRFKYSLFREGFKANIISEEATRQAIEMTDHRNLTTHGYNEELVEAIAQQIPKYYNLMNNILNKTKI